MTRDDSFYILDYGIATPLILAAGSGRLDIARVLLQHGASINHTEKDMTVLMTAAQGGHTNMVELLLQNDAEVTLRKSTKASDLAADSGHISTLDVLLRHGADPDGYVEESLTHAQDPYDSDSNFSYPTLIKAIEKGYVEVVQMLLDYGAEIQGKDFQGKTPLMYAIDNDDWDMVWLLLESDADPTEEHDMN